MSSEEKKDKQAEAPAQVRPGPAQLPKIWDQTVELMKAYPKEKFNQLLPTVTVVDVHGSLYKPTVEIVTIDPTLPVTDGYGKIKKEGSGEVYQDKRMREGTVALGRRGLQKFQHAGGLIFPPQINQITWDAKSAFCQAAGAMKKADGSLIVITASKLVDLELEEIKFRAQAQNRNEWREKDGKAPWTAEEIEAQVHRDLIQARENMVQNAETKAQNRVIRKAFALKDAYPIAELRKPFVLIRYDQNFDPSDPNQMRLIMQQANDASGRLFGRPIEVNRPPGEPVQVQPADHPPQAAAQVDDLDAPPPAGPDPQELDGAAQALQELIALGYEALKKRFRAALGKVKFEDPGEKEQLQHAWRTVHTILADTEEEASELRLREWATVVLKVEQMVAS